MSKNNVIPSGPYCYKIREIVQTDSSFRMALRVCPYMSSKDGESYCLKIRKKNSEIPLSLLWDSVKECGIKLDDPEDVLDDVNFTKKTLTEFEF